MRVRKRYCHPSIRAVLHAIWQLSTEHHHLNCWEFILVSFTMNSSCHSRSFLNSHHMCEQPVIGHLWGGLKVSFYSWHIYFNVYVISHVQHCECLAVKTVLSSPYLNTIQHLPRLRDPHHRVRAFWTGVITFVFQSGWQTDRVNEFFHKTAQSWWIRQTIPCTSWVSFW